MSTAVNHRKRSHRSHRKAGYAAGARKRLAVSGQDGLRGFGLFRGIFRSRAREGSGPMKASAPTPETVIGEAAE